MAKQITIEELMKKRVSELTPEEKEFLREWFLEHASKRSLAQDLRKTSRKIPAFVKTWITHPGRYDIPGVDTPESTAVVQGLKKLYRVLITNTGIYVDNKFYGWGDIKKILRERYPDKILILFKEKAREHGYDYPIYPVPAYKELYKSKRPRFAIYMVEFPPNYPMKGKYLVIITYNVGQSLIRTKGITGNTAQELIEKINQLKYLKPNIKQRIIEKIKQLIKE